jgi:hypothetical protein
VPYKIPKVARLGNAGAGDAWEVLAVPAVDDVKPCSAERQSFRSLSAVLTGFSELELEASGVEDLYLGFLLARFRDVLDEVLVAWAAIEREYPPVAREAGVRTRVLGDPKLGPFVRSVLAMWYTATWTAMKPDWSQAYGDHHDVTAVIKGAYPEGLVWRAGGLHPQGAKPTGFGTWAFPPAVV